MSHWRHVVEIARWEFLRFFKWRDLVLSLALMGGVSALAFGFSFWQERSRRIVDLAVISSLPIDLPAARFRVERVERDREAELRAAVARGDGDGLLVVEPPAARLVVRKEPGWSGDVAAAVSAAMRQQHLEHLGLTPAELAAALVPAPVRLEIASGDGRAAAGGRKLAFLLTGIMLLMVFLGIAYLFTGITGEKQERVTEQIFSMTSAQALIDGKLLGTLALAALGTAQMLAIAVVAARVFAGGVPAFVLQGVLGVSAWDGAMLVAFAAAGVVFWFAACAALFATINDPHSSARTNAVLLPLVPLSAAFLGTGNPDSSMMQVLAWLPLTSMTVMPARVVLTDVPMWQPIGSLALLLAATAAIRRGTGRIYETGMLLYGKEPGVRDMLRWMRARR